MLSKDFRADIVLKVCIKALGITSGVFLCPRTIGTSDHLDLDVSFCLAQRHFVLEIVREPNNITDWSSENSPNNKILK